MTKTDLPDAFKVQTLALAADLREKLEPDQWLLFARAVQLERSSLNKILDSEDVSPTTTTAIRVCACLETVGITTLLSKLSSPAKMVAMEYGLTKGGSLKEFIPDDTERDAFMAYVRGVRGLPSSTAVSVGNLATQLQADLVQARGWSKVDMTALVAIKKQLESDAPVAIPTRKEPEKLTVQQDTSAITAGTSRMRRFREKTLDLLAFANYYAAPSTSDEEREALRKVVGQDNIFKLKNLLLRLTSSSAFNNPNYQ